MYYNILVKIPENTGRITRNKRGKTTYIEYTYGRKHIAEKKYNVPQRTTIGKQSDINPTMMQPNQNFVKFFPEIPLSGEWYFSNRSSCLRIGAYLVIRKIMEEYKIPDILLEYWDNNGVGLFLDLVAYSIICENNDAQYYPDYTYNHPLMTENMKIYSDPIVSEFLTSISIDDQGSFLKSWNEFRNHRERIYIYYNSTDKNCQAGDVEMVEFGHPKADLGTPVFNYSVAYDVNNREPLFYEAYSGSIVDVPRLQYMLKKAKGYGYKNIGFILDRGCFHKGIIKYMDDCKYEFVIMVRGMASFAQEIILSNKGSFEKKRLYAIPEYQVYGKTVQGKLYGDDVKDRYLHIFHEANKESDERAYLENRILEMSESMKKQEGKSITFEDDYHHYFEIFEYKKDDGTKCFLYAKEKGEVIEKELGLCGYFVIVTSNKMTAQGALSFYKGRDVSEKLFREDKSYLDSTSLEVVDYESGDLKILIEFVALIVRSKIYTRLETMLKNYMTVPAAMKELERIEMVRQLDNVYRLDRSLTAGQKLILKAFGINESYVKAKAASISNQFKNATPPERGGEDDTEITNLLRGMTDV